MSSRDQATASVVGRLVVAGNSTILSIGLAICATTSWVKYLAFFSSLDRIPFTQTVPSPRISDLRALPAASDGECDGEPGEGKMVVVRCQVHLKPTVDSNWMLILISYNDRDDFPAYNLTHKSKASKRNFLMKIGKNCRCEPADQSRDQGYLLDQIMKKLEPHDLQLYGQMLFSCSQGINYRRNQVQQLH